MNLTKTTIILTLVSLMSAAILIFWGKNINCQSLFAPRNSLVDHMKRFNPSSKKNALNKELGGKVEAKPCLAVKREVFVDGRRLYWGNLGELKKPERFFAPRTVLQTTVTQNALTPREALHHFTQELRTALKVFEKRYCLKINWRKKTQAMPDVTAQFINFWDKEFGRTKDTNERNPEEKMERGDSQ